MVSTTAKSASAEPDPFENATTWAIPVVCSLPRTMPNTVVEFAARQSGIELQYHCSALMNAVRIEPSRLNADWLSGKLASSNGSIGCDQIAIHAPEPSLTIVAGAALDCSVSWLPPG